MSKLKRLAGQTAIYGVSTILVRSLNWLINPFHTYVFGENQSDLGIVVELYAYVAFINVLLMYGMETAFFRFASKEKEHANRVFSTSLLSLLLTSSIFFVLIALSSQRIAALLQYPHLSHIVLMLGAIISFDTLANIPFAKLRLENKPMTYVRIKLLNVVITVGLNVFLLTPILMGRPEMFGFKIQQEHALTYVFMANLLASFVTLLVFVPDLLRTKMEFCKDTWLKMMRYALPLVIVGLAGIVNETIDRILLKYLLPQESLAERNAIVGIYGSVYKLAIFMSLVVQAYRMGAEPFFFSQSKDKDALGTVAKAMTLFVVLGMLIFLGVSLNLDWIILVLHESYRVGKNIVPILLMAYLFLGIFYNLSVWYKLRDKTHYAMFISISGALVTILINMVFIPKYGYWASAWATLASYFTMTLISWQWGKRYYAVPYDLVRIMEYFILGLGLYGLAWYVEWSNQIWKLLFNNMLVLIFFAYAVKRDILSLWKER